MLINLIVNAQQALAADRRGAFGCGTRQRAGEVLIEVEDNGPGMPPRSRKRIFEPFFTTKPQGLGTGIGLSVCHGIVTAHGGRIAVGQPALATARVLLSLPHREAGHGRPAATPIAALPVRGRVLVVDDEQEIAELIAEHLRRDGLTVEVVASGRQALAAAEAETFDLIVSDLRMPDLDGPPWSALRAKAPSSPAEWC